MILMISLVVLILDPRNPILLLLLPKQLYHIIIMIMMISMISWLDSMPLNLNPFRINRRLLSINPLLLLVMI